MDREAALIGSVIGERDQGSGIREKQKQQQQQQRRQRPFLSEEPLDGVECVG
jgi:hypothetical protein